MSAKTLATQEQFSTEGDRVSLVQRPLRYEESEQKKLKEMQEEPELGHKLENLTQVLARSMMSEKVSNHSRNKLHNSARTSPIGEKKQ
jgi:hypothetical protein